MTRPFSTDLHPVEEGAPGNSRLRLRSAAVSPAVPCDAAALGRPALRGFGTEDQESTLPELEGFRRNWWLLRPLTSPKFITRGRHTVLER